MTRPLSLCTAPASRSAGEREPASPKWTPRSSRPCARVQRGEPRNVPLAPLHPPPLARAPRVPGGSGGGGECRAPRGQGGGSGSELAWGARAGTELGAERQLVPGQARTPHPSPMATVPPGEPAVFFGLGLWEHFAKVELGTARPGRFLMKCVVCLRNRQVSRLRRAHTQRDGGEGAPARPVGSPRPPSAP